MMRRFFTLTPLLVALLMPTGAWADDLNVGETFIVNNITYKVYENYEAWVGDGLSAAIPLETTGEVAIPSSVIGPDGIQYRIKCLNVKAFTGCSNITTVIIPESVTKFQHSCFYQCGLKYITIPNSVEMTGPLTSVFRECSKLVSVTLPEKTNAIGDYFFYKCSSLTTVNIPANVTEIGRSAFSHCSSLNSVVLPENIKEIKGEAFSRCTNLTSINIPTAITTIEPSLFSNCEKLRTIVLPNAVTSIGNFAFYGCSSLESINMPENLATIGNNAFMLCENLKTISFPSSLTTIGNQAFYRCWALESLFIPRFLANIEKKAFCNSSLNMREIKVEAGNSKYDSRNNCNALIETETDELLFGCKNTVIPNSVKTIGEEAFENCYFDTNSRDLVFPNSITTIKNSAYNYSNLTSISIPKSVITIEKYAFANNTKLDKVTSYIESPFPIESVFLKVPIDATLYVPVGTKAKYEATEGWNVFKNIVEMEPTTKELKVGETFETDGITYMVSKQKPMEVVVGTDPWYDGEEHDELFNLRAVSQETTGKIIIPSTVEAPDGNVYSVTSIGYRAFRFCEKITEVSLPSTITLISDQAFEGCSGLTNINLPQSITEIGSYAFSQCRSLTSVDIPNSVTIIEEYAFAHNINMASLVLSNSLTEIREGAFYHCASLASVIIPGSVKAIGKNAFSECESLKNVRLNITEPFKLDEAFRYISEEATLYVPVGTKAKYEATEGWKEFKNIVEMDPSGIATVLTEQKANETIYNLSGQRFATPRRGLNIIGGKKVVVR